MVATALGGHWPHGTAQHRAGPSCRPESDNVRRQTRCMVVSWIHGERVFSEGNFNDFAQALFPSRLEFYLLRLYSELYCKPKRMLS